jgi:hypothetical protein
MHNIGPRINQRVNNLGLKLHPLETIIMMSIEEQSVPGSSLNIGAISRTAIDFHFTVTGFAGNLLVGFPDLNA